MIRIAHFELQDGLSQTRLLYLNFEDDRLADVAGGDLQAILDAYFELYPEYGNAKNLHFFFDDIHEVSGWEKFIRRLLDTEQIHIYISGSSAKMLSKEIATSLRGRTITREIFPYNFREYLKHRRIAFPKRLSSKEKAAMVSYVQQFILWGGFPETVEASSSVHRELLQGYVDSVIYRDIIDRYHITNTVGRAKLIARIYETNPLICQCGKEIKIIAFVTHPLEIRRILIHIGWPLTAPEFDPPYKLPDWDVCQLLPWTEDGFSQEEVKVHDERGPDPPVIKSYSDPPQWDDHSDPPHWEDSSSLRKTNGF